MLTSLLGGIGLFLIGITLLTDGLKAAAGDGLRNTLVRFTGGPVRSVIAGAGITALVQSSTATTLTTIGFVSAGLLTFPQAVGVVFGANIGTTSTGWLVAGFGLKMSVLPAALSMVGVGALVRLLARGRVASAGLALAGFGLVFVGIDTLQLGMAGLAEQLSPDSFPGRSWMGRLALLGVGFGMTVVLQSSSAAVATTLAALGAGAIDLSQGAALVIGQNVGTTLTAGLAAIGASVPAKRTALAHVLFNVFTAAVAFVLLPLFVLGGRWIVEHDALSAPLTLATFQTVFNLLGVAILLPVTAKFAAGITRLVPDSGPHLTRFLDRSVTRLPAVAIETAHRTLKDIVAWVVPAADPRRAPPSKRTLAALRDALHEVREFLAEIRAEPETPDVHTLHVSAIHAVDHLEQLVGLLAPGRARATAAADHDLADVRAEVGDVMDAAQSWLSGGGASAAVAATESKARLATRVGFERERIIEDAAAGATDADDALGRLEALRWLEAIAHHVDRVVQRMTAAPAAG